MHGHRRVCGHPQIMSPCLVCSAAGENVSLINRKTSSTVNIIR